MEIKINFEKRHMVLLITSLALLTLFGFAYAQTAPGSITDPSKGWHMSNQVDLNGDVSLSDIAGLLAVVYEDGATEICTNEKLEDTESDCRTVLNTVIDSRIPTQNPTNNLWTENGNNIYYSEGSVGIGTSNPVGLLHTSTASDVTNTLRVQVRDSSTNPKTGDAILSLLLTGDTHWTVGVDNSDADKFKISGGGSAAPGTNDKVIIDTSGNVGIGTDSPSSLLDVAGKVRSTGLASRGTVLQIQENDVLELTGNLRFDENSQSGKYIQLPGYQNAGSCSNDQHIGRMYVDTDLGIPCVCVRSPNFHWAPFDDRSGACS